MFGAYINFLYKNHKFWLSILRLAFECLWQLQGNQFLGRLSYPLFCFHSDLWKLGKFYLSQFWNIQSAPLLSLLMALYQLGATWCKILRKMLLSRSTTWCFHPLSSTYGWTAHLLLNRSCHKSRVSLHSIVFREPRWCQRIFVRPLTTCSSRDDTSSPWVDIGFWFRPN